MTQLKVTLYKDRQKFSSAHFTLFLDGSLERLHGHNYRVAVSFSGQNLEMGLLAPFHHLKPLISELCDQWDERVLIPTQSPMVEVVETGTQCEVTVTTEKAERFYSFPREDVVLLPCDNISSENLALLFVENLGERVKNTAPNIQSVSATVGETDGQEVTAELKLN